jgi:hypothetical protein
LAHQIAAALSQQVGAVLVLERAYRIGDVSLQRMTVLPIQGLGAVRGYMLGYTVEQVSNDMMVRVGPDARSIPRKYVVGATPQQQFERLREQVLYRLAGGFVGVGHYPATKAESV